MLPPGKKFEFKFQWALILHQGPVENTLILRGFRADSIQEGAFLHGHLLLSLPKWPKYAYHNGYGIADEKQTALCIAAIGSLQLAVSLRALYPLGQSVANCQMQIAFNAVHGAIMLETRSSI
jgi:hypothetical protein